MPDFSSRAKQGNSLLCDRLLAALDALCRDSLEQPLEVVLAIPEGERGHVDAMFFEIAALVERLARVAESAKSFVATTSYYRQQKASRPEFEELALALLVARGDYETVSRPEHWEREQMGAPE